MHTIKDRYEDPILDDMISREILIDNRGNSNELEDYQVDLAIDEKQLFFEAQDGLRFVDENLKIIKHWNESFPKQWVKIPRIPASAMTALRMLNSKNGIGSASDYNNTFVKNYGESGLIGLWHCDDGTGTNVAESSGGGANNGAFSGSLAWAGADGGQWNGINQQFSTGDSIDFIGGYVNVPDSAALDVNSITIMLWAKPDAVLDGKIITRDDVATNRIFQLYEINVDGDLQWLHSTVGTPWDINIVTTADPFTAGSWHLIACTYDATSGNAYLYVDGIEVGSDTATGNLRAGTNAIRIGSCEASGDNFNGKMDEIRYYNRALSLPEITRYFKRSKYTSPAPTTVIEVMS